MMNKFLPLIVTSLSLAFSISAKAYYSAVEHAAVLSSISLKGVWHKPSQNGDAFIPINLTVPASTATGLIFHTDDYDLNFGFNYTFRVPDTDAWFYLDWTDVTSKVARQNVQTTAIPGGVLLPNGLAFPAPLAALNPGANTEFMGALTYREKALNIGIRYLTMCCQETYDFTWGAYVQWAKLERNHVLSYVDPAAPNNTQRLSAREKPEGGGPYFDLTAHAYPWGKSGRCYSIFGHAGVAFLLMNNRYTYIRDLNGTQELVLAPDTSSAIINKIVADIGVAYDRTFRGVHYWRLGLAFSLNYTNYINLFKNGNSAADFTYDYGTWAPTLTITIGGVES